MSLFENTKNTAKLRGLSLQRTAELSGLSKNAIYNWKTIEPSPVSLKAVADVLNVSVDYLLGNTDDMHASKKVATYGDDLKEYFDEHPILKFDGKEIPDAEMKIIKRILEDMDD
ncbi:helix-turn-helix domain-containing protein [Weissella hellenica]|uniref:helix-turn-helix domain-containing protein n=1 Tax=Weissella hellenica TaxID=46256 RepID=UPI0038876B2D